MTDTDAEQGTMRGRVPSVRTVARIGALVAIWLLTAAGAILAGSAMWIRRHFGEVSVDQMLLNLPAAGGAEITDAETGYIASFVWEALVLPLAVVLAAAATGWAFRRALTRRRSRRAPDAGAAPAPRRRPGAPGWVVATLPAAVAVTAFVTGATLFVQASGVAQYLRSSLSSLTMAVYYVVPATGEGVRLTATPAASEPLNLVVIYLESADDLFSDAELFGENLMEPLDRVTQDWPRIDSLHTYEGGGWTMAGIVGTQCGVPLRGPGIGENDINSNAIGQEQAEYLPGAICLGDVLADAGYASVFLGGADASFASKGDFLRAHGYGEVRDLEHWQAQGETESSEWGLSDRALMEQARAEVTRLHEAGEPFNLTMLTLDFHEPLHVYDYCPVTTDEPLSSVLRCSVGQVAGFVEYLADSGYLEDTVVVIMGDHPKMLADGGAYASEFSGLDYYADRVLYNRIWSPTEISPARDSIDQLSVYATVLDLLGLGRDDGRAGLGLSAFSTGGAAAEHALALPVEEYRELLQSRSADLYRTLWGAEEENVEADSAD